MLQIGIYVPRLTFLPFVTSANGSRDRHDKTAASNSQSNVIDGKNKRMIDADVPMTGRADALADCKRGYDRLGRRCVVPGSEERCGTELNEAFLRLESETERGG